jgi:hypothetical protein
MPPQVCVDDVPFKKEIKVEYLIIFLVFILFVSIVGLALIVYENMKTVRELKKEIDGDKTKKRLEDIDNF